MRELLEETGYEAEIKDLLLIVENFFHLDETDHHELAFIYAISPTDPAFLKPLLKVPPKTPRHMIVREPH